MFKHEQQRTQRLTSLKSIKYLIKYNLTITVQSHQSKQSAINRGYRKKGIKKPDICLVFLIR
jgi:hypothetical protein